MEVSRATRRLYGAWHPGREGWMVAPRGAGLMWAHADGTPGGIFLPAALVAEDSSWHEILVLARP